VQRVTELSASNGDYDFRDLLQDFLDAMQMPQVKWLVSTNQKSSMSVRVQIIDTPFREYLGAVFLSTIVDC
jgi:hypothetical protein